MPAVLATHVWFIRHGEVEAGLIGRFIGSTEAALSPLGQHQAHAVAAFLEDAPIDALVSSPRRRSRETIAPLAQQKDLPVETRPGFAEMHFGDWERLTWSEIEARDAELARCWADDPGSTRCPGGQTADEFARGVADELAQLLDEFKGRTIAIAAHSGVNRAILAAVLERPYLEMFRFAQDYGCVNAAAWTDAGAQVALLNMVPGPRSEHPSW